MCNKLVVLTALCVLVGLAGARHATLAAAPQQPRSGLQRLIARAEAAGRVRVIVGQRGAHQPERELHTAAAVLEQREREAQTRQSIVSSVRAGVIGRVQALDTLPYFTADVDATSLAELAASPLVGSIEEDVARPMTLSQSVPLVGAPQAWDAGYSGAGWTIAILDSGVDGTHPFLAGKVVGEACYSTTDDSGVTTSTSLCPGGLATASGSGVAAPCRPVVQNCDHGTHVAGIAAGAGPSFSGVARDASLLAIQVFSKFGAADCGGSDCLLAWDSDVLAALDHVYALRDSMRIAAVNLSLGGSIYGGACDDVSPAMAAGIQQLRDAGVPTVIASGNGGSTAGLAFPACLSAAVSVGSTTKTDIVSSFSNSSASLALLAPGEPINSSVPGGGFAYKMGTSMAAPHVAGAWAVLKQRKPTATVDELLGALRTTGAPVTDGRPGSGVSFPRIRVKAALDALPTSDPLMMIDVPVGGTMAEPFRLAGWAIDRGASTGSGVDAVHIWAYPSDGRAPVFAGVATTGVPRADIGPVLGSQFVDGGYATEIRGLAPGAYQLVVFAHSTVTGTFNQARVVDITIPASSPAMVVDSPRTNSTVGSAFVVAGWAIDRSAPSGTGVDAVHVWAFPVAGGDPIFAGAASCGVARTDVGQLMGHQFDASGYSLYVSTLPPGSYDLVVFARSTVTGTFNQAIVVRVTVQPQP
jgi:subtilisin family serine protease